mgnify:CR=1 FL=1
MNALYWVLKRMIEKGNTEGLEAKIDVFYAVGKLSDAEYNELISMLHPEE